MFSFAELLESCFTFSGIYPLFYLSNCSAKISSLPYPLLVLEFRLISYRFSPSFHLVRTICL